MSEAAKLSPRQRECLALVWERRATSKEIALALGISKATVDGYIAEAVEVLGARDRRDAAWIAFGAPPALSGDNAARVTEPASSEAEGAASTPGMVPQRPWRSVGRPRNTMTLAQTLGWIAIIAIGSLVALSLATSIGNGLPSVAGPLLQTFDRLTR